MTKHKDCYPSGEWGGSWDCNVYYEPESCGLRLVASLEKDLSYEYDTIILVQCAQTGSLWLCHDAGCSCPTPFEEVHSFADMTPLRSERQIDLFIDQHDSDGEYAFRQPDLNEFRRKARAALRKHKKETS